MIIMALDHTRDFYHVDANLFDPTDLTKTTPFLFFTRIITHYCAPTFVFLSGVSAYISTQRKTKKELSRFLLTRGLWLILLELTIIRFSFVFNLYYDFTILQVIWTIGASMVLLSVLIFLPHKFIGPLGLVIIATHNIFDAFRFNPGDPGFLPVALLNQGGFLPFSNERFLIIGYPVFPWLGIMLAGFGVGAWYGKGFEAATRKKYLLISGLVATALFIILRSINAYGDPAPWYFQKDVLFTVMSFLNVSKYPPSLMYTLMTLGPVLILLSLIEPADQKIWKPIIVFGRVPLFYYILHFYLIHASALAVYMTTHHVSFGALDFHYAKGFGGIPVGAGFSLGIVYLAWISIVTALYPLCRWYNQYKSTHHQWWLSYL